MHHVRLVVERHASAHDRADARSLQILQNGVVDFFLKVDRADGLHAADKGLYRFRRGGIVLQEDKRMLVILFQIEQFADGLAVERKPQVRYQHHDDLSAVLADDLFAAHLMQCGFDLLRKLTAHLFRTVEVAGYGGRGNPGCKRQFSGGNLHAVIS